MTVLVESFVTPVGDQAVQTQLISFPQDSTSFEIRTDETRQYHQRQKGETPRYIKAKEPILFTFQGDFFVSMGKDTILKVVELNQEFAHLKLISGFAQFDHRFSSKAAFVQSGNLALVPEPFSRSLVVYEGGQSQAYSLDGHHQLELNIGTKKHKQHYLTAGQKLTLKDTAATAAWQDYDRTELISELSQQNFAEAPAELKRLAQINLDNYLRQETPMQVSYKQQEGYQPPLEITEKIIVNPVKKNITILNRLSNSLNTAREQFSTEQPKEGNKSLQEFRSELSDLITDDKKAALPQIITWLQLYASTSEDSLYQPIKQVLTEMAVLAFSQDQLQDFWTYAVDSLPTWQKSNQYFKVISLQIKANAKKQSELEAIKARLLYQYGQFPAKNTVAAYKLLQESNAALLAQSQDEEKFNAKTSPELVQLIKTLKEFNENGLIENEATVEPLILLLDQLETDYENSLLADEPYDDFLAEQLPNIIEFLGQIQRG